jgi:hypothetical protein
MLSLITIASPMRRVKTNIAIPPDVDVAQLMASKYRAADLIFSSTAENSASIWLARLLISGMIQSSNE